MWYKGFPASRRKRVCNVDFEEEYLAFIYFDLVFFNWSSVTMLLLPDFTAIKRINSFLF